MKKPLYFLLFLVIGLSAFSQNNIDSIHPLMRGEIDGDLIRESYLFSSNRYPNKNRVGKHIIPPIIIGMFSSNKLTITKLLPHEKLKEINEFSKKSDSIIEVPQNGYPGNKAIPIFDSLGIIVTANGITRDNAYNFEFRVLENKTNEIVPWRGIHLFCEQYMIYLNDNEEEKDIAYLGEFKTSFGNSLTIEIREKEKQTIVGSMSAIWINRSPKVLGTFTAGDMPAFLEVFKNQWQHDILMLQTREERLAKDSLLKEKKEFEPGENSIIFYLDDKVRSKEVIEYNLVSRNKNSGWKANDFDLNLVWLKDLSPGKYVLQLRYSVQRHNVSEYEFYIESAWHQTRLVRIFAVVFVLLMIAAILALIRILHQRQRIITENLQKKIKQTELKTIRAQLNPHFIFNSLNSIQGLITINETDKANQYLSEFSTLMRESLTENENDFTSLSSEIKMLSSYLKLEQLRFGFKYNLQVDPDLNTDAIEVPAMLLQPPVENSIKHGVSPLYEKGEITIGFSKKNADMIVSITDNGGGFDVTETPKGIGLKLTKDRLALANSLLKEQSIEFDIISGAKGTVAIFHFKNWLA